MFLVLAIALFSVFAVNVGVGSAGQPPFLSDIDEMLTLFAASIAFVIAILRREAAAKRYSSQNE